MSENDEECVSVGGLAVDLGMYPPAEEPSRVLFQPKPVAFDIIKDDIARLALDYGTLKVQDENDKDGYALCHQARMEVRELRVGVEKRRKELKRDALDYGKIVDSAARELTDLLLPIEDRLIVEEQKVTEAEKRRKEAEQAKRDALIRTRLASLRACEYPGSVTFNAEDINPDQPTAEFDAFLAIAQSDKREYDDRQLAEQTRINLEKQKLADEASRIKRMHARSQMLAELNCVTHFSAEALADLTPDEWEVILESARRDDEHRRKVAAEKEAENKRLLKELEDKANESLRQEREEQDRKRAELLKPDHEKIMAYADALDAVPKPELSDEARIAGGYAATALLADVTRRIRSLASEIVRPTLD